jgi:hypothetical protein
MKIRNGFVSNSSSSSFVILSKGELTNYMLEQINDIPKTSIFYSIFDSICNCIFNNIEKIEKKELYENWYSNAGETAIQSASKYYNIDIENISPEWNIYIGNVGNDCGMIEELICGMEIHYKSDNLIIIKNEVIFKDFISKYDLIKNKDKK